MVKKIHGYQRGVPRFSAPEQIVLMFSGNPVVAIDMSETGMRIAVPKNFKFLSHKTYEFDLLIRDGLSVEGWNVSATCIWALRGEAGFRFNANHGFTKPLYLRLMRLVSLGRTKVTSGTEV